MRTLILFAHPRLSNSVVQKALLQSLEGLAGVTLHDLYAAYPDFGIDIGREQQMLLDHDLIVLQHPFYWYSCPAIVKEWLDLVLELGWAYGPGGIRLHRKYLMNAISTGGDLSAYQPGGRNRFSIADLLTPFNQTAHLCGMAYLEPFSVFAGRWLSAEEFVQAAADYRELIGGLAGGRIDPLSRLAADYALPKAFAAKSPGARHAS
jgi:glutathione-regulated potassium-efflux system ancillary protein KefG